MSKFKVGDIVETIDADNIVKRQVGLIFEITGIDIPDSRYWVKGIINNTLDGSARETWLKLHKGQNRNGANS